MTTPSDHNEQKPAFALPATSMLPSAVQLDRMSLPEVAAALKWLQAMGVDEFAQDMPADQFALSVQPAPTGMPPASHTAAPQGGTHSPNATAASIMQSARTQIAASRAAPTFVTPQPPAGILGAGAATAASTAASASTLRELEEALKNFDGGHLKRSAKNTVFATGPEDAPILMIGEAPGADEDRLGEPFVGVSGQLLDKMLAAANLSRTKNVRITNLVPWRPLGNKAPDVATQEMCLPFLRRHIALCQPKIIISLGATPTRALLGVQDGISRLRGRWKTLELDGRSYDLMPLYHPSYLLRQPAMKRYAWQDLLSALERL